MKTLVVGAMSAILISGCVNDPDYQLTKRLQESTLILQEDIKNTPPSAEAKLAAEKYSRLANEATPSDWAVGNTWRLEIDPLDGRSPIFAIFRITDTPAPATCIGGDWRQLEVVHSEGLDPRAPAFLVNGRHLAILLSTGLCDAYDEVKGELSPTGFRGWRTSSGMFGSSRTGRATGRAIARRD